MDFREVLLSDKEVMDKYFRARYYENSHYSFTNVFMWRHHHNMKWAEEDGALYIEQRRGGKLYAMQPITDEANWEAATKKWLDYFAKVGEVPAFYAVEKDYADFLRSFSADFTITAERDLFDYVYLSEKLRTLAGRKLHSKKNHLNAFKKMYPEAEYLPITAEIIPECRAGLNAWYEQREKEQGVDDMLASEREAIIEIFDAYDKFALEGGAIRLGGQIIAFTLGEQINSDTAVIHVEKANPDIRGAYPAINQAFVEHAWQNVAYINREEDLGEEGLRKAKESYKPEKMIEKYMVMKK